MAAKGALLKQEVAEKIIAAFPNKSFLYNDGKEIRINGTENGENLQIKVTLTCAKVAVQQEEVTPTGSIKVEEGFEKVPAEPTQEEKERLAKLLNQLGIANE